MYTMKAPPYLERVLSTMPPPVAEGARAEFQRVLRLAEGGVLFEAPVCAARCGALRILCVVEPTEQRVVVHVVVS